MLRVIFFNNAKTRLPFKGVAGFYRALCRGMSNHPSHNPIFYVSGSPWNLYDLLIDFMQTQQIPLGPLFLRDFGLSMDKFIKRSTKRHKLEQIEHILTLYPDLPFILIGDSGEKDPEIYQQVVQDFPGRILAIYIREISLEGRQAEIDLLIEELGKQDVEMVLVPDTEVAALHAVDRGFISRESLADIQIEKTKDETGPSDLEQLLEQV
jgi:phosphatidate phosphatase APP1